MLKNITESLLYCYVENNSYPWFISFKKEKKTFILKPRRTCNKTLSFQELVACAAAGGLFAVSRVVVSFVVCKVRDSSQTHQTKLPATQTLYCFIKTLRTLTISSHLTYSRLVNI